VKPGSPSLTHSSSDALQRSSTPSAGSSLWGVTLPGITERTPRIRTWPAGEIDRPDSGRSSNTSGTPREPPASSTASSLPGRPPSVVRTPEPRPRLRPPGRPPSVVRTPRPRPRRPGGPPKRHLYGLSFSSTSSTVAAILSNTPAASHFATFRLKSSESSPCSICTTSAPTDLTSVCSRDWQTDVLRHCARSTMKRWVCRRLAYYGLDCAPL